MKLVTYLERGAPRAGAIVRDGTVVAAAKLVDGAPRDMLGIIEAGPKLWARLGKAAARAKGGRALERVELLAPIPRPRRNVMCVGWNYLEHFEEGRGLRGGQDTPEIPPYPALFSKNPATVTAHECPVFHSAPYSEQLDYEVELAVIIGTPGRDIAEKDALGHVFGYTIANDISVRDVQRRHGGQWFKGKNFDSHLPMGPCIVTADEIPDPQALRLGTRVNGVVKQDSSTRWMVFKVPRIIREFSAGMTLEAGDVIITGTPEGVGFARKPPEFLKPGDLMELEIERIGVLRNRVTARA